MKRRPITRMGLALFTGQAAAAGVALYVLVGSFMPLAQQPVPTAAVVAVPPTANAPTAEPASQPGRNGRLPPVSASTTPPEAGPPAASDLLAAPGPASNAAATSHVVAAGENLYRISLRYGVSLPDLMRANGISDPNQLYAGQQLAIPTSAAPGPDGPVPSPTAHALTATPGPTPTPSPTPLPPEAVNQVPITSFAGLSREVVVHISAVYAHGQQLGSNPRAFSKLGDSTIENPFFLARFDQGPYDLGQYAYLETTIDYFAGSFGRQGVAVRRGMHAWTATDPMWADKSLCRANESPVACEIRLHRPSILIVRLGSNDAGAVAGFERNIRLVIELALEQGVIPVLGTKADRIEGAANTFNDILRRLAEEYAIPLWDFDLVAQTIPGRGLGGDGVHLTAYYAHDYTSPTAFQRGHSVHNLTALIMLDELRQALAIGR